MHAREIRTTTVIASASLQELEKGAGVAVTGGGSLMPMPDLIRLAARAHHYLYVYDQHTGQSLYLGRAKQLDHPQQRQKPNRSVRKSTDIDLFGLRREQIDDPLGHRGGGRMLPQQRRGQRQARAFLQRAP